MIVTLFACKMDNSGSILHLLENVCISHDKFIEQISNEIHIERKDKTNVTSNT